MKTIYAVLLAIMVQGCANLGGTPLTVEQQEVLNTGSVEVKYFEAPSLYIQTPKSVVGDGLIARLTESDDLPFGKSLEESFNIPDPAYSLVETIVPMLESNGLAIDSVSESPLPLPYDKSKAYENSNGYVIELRVNNWSASYGPLKWKTYNFSYRTYVRVLNGESESVYWKGYCNQYVGSDERMQLHISKFEENDGQNIKDILRLAVDSCAENITAKLAGGA